ncbi:hypothetical protein ACEQ6A_15315 [Rhizobium brockwellii]
MWNSDIKPMLELSTFRREPWLSSCYWDRSHAENLPRDVGNVAHEPSTLSVRLEALELVSEGAGDISLPVLQVEFAGNEVGILYDGSGIGTGWIRVQMRPETFARLGHRASVGERLVMQIVPDAPCFSTQQAEG